MGLRKRLGILGVVGAMVALFASGSVFAQTSAPNRQGDTTYQEYFMDHLASALGTTRDTLNSAITQATNETIDQQVSDGKLSSEQAEKIKARGGSFFAGFGGMGGDDDRGDGGLMFMGGSGINEAIAGALGISTDELASQIKSGKSLAELAQGKEQAVKDAIVAAVDAQLDQAVADGKMTQEQADQMLERVKNADLDSFLGRGGPAAGGGSGGEPPSDGKQGGQPASGGDRGAGAGFGQGRN